MQNSSKLDEAEILFFEELQSFMSSKPIHLPKNIRTICGVDAAYSEVGKRITATATLFKDGLLEETSTYSGSFTFPYVSGLFFLHEGPFAVAAVRKLLIIPELVCFDSHGLLHPRHKGLATVCGMVLQIPSVGIAKTPLVGEEIPYKSELNKIRLGTEELGFVTKRGSKRYWSLGYSVTIRELETIISKLGEICLNSLVEAHKVSRIEISKVA